MDDSIGFIGLGTMGGPMAANLLQAGKNLVVHNICPETEKPLCEQGATWTDDITDMRKRADVIISSLPGPKEIEQVGLSANGLVDALGEGAVQPQSEVGDLGLLRREGLDRASEAAAAVVARGLCDGRGDESLREALLQLRPLSFATAAVAVVRLGGVRCQN